MQRILKSSLILIATLLTVVACNNDDGYSLDNYSISYGTINRTDNSYNIQLDNGVKLYVSASLIPQYEFKDAQRVIANYTILGEASAKSEAKGYIVRLNNIYNVLSKAPVKQSFIDTNSQIREDSIGHDPIDVVYAWFSGKYLNINFEVQVSANSSVKHFINLVHDDVTVDPDGYVNVTLRHNAYGVPGSYVGFGRVSFDITSLVPESANQVNVRLKWKDYSGKENSDTGTFKLNSSAQNGDAQRMSLDKAATTVE